MFGDDKFFREGLFALSLAAKDNLADFDDILNFAISDDLPVLKLLKVQRLFHFLSSSVATTRGRVASGSPACTSLTRHPH
jgi:hypothetical protein